LECRNVVVSKKAYRLVQQVLPKYSHTKSPHHFELPQLAACVLVMFYLGMSYRDMEEWLFSADQVCEELELPRIPDHTTLQRTYMKLAYLDFEKMKHQIQIMMEEERRREQKNTARTPIFSTDRPGWQPLPRHEPVYK
jgi:hypothetical protein